MSIEPSSESVEPSLYAGLETIPLKVAIATSSGVNCGLSITSKWKFFSPEGVASFTSIGIIGGPGPSLPITAVRRSCVSVPIIPPVDMTFVEAIDDASVRITCPRVSGIATAPNPNNRMPTSENPIGFHQGYRAAWAIDKSPRTSSMPTMSPGLRLASSGDASRSAAGHRRHAPGRKLFSELGEGFRIKAG